MISLETGPPEFRYTAMIRHNPTGEVRSYHDTWELQHGEGGLIFMWTEGNYGCDCNRKTFFERAANPAYKMPEQSVCGDTGYSVNLVVEGRTIHKEFDL